MLSGKKIKLLTISDHPLTSSGVGIQTKHVIEGLLDTGKFTVVSLGAAISHKDYRPQKIDKYGDDWKIYPVNGYGNPQILREVMDNEKPDALFFVTDPRFYTWLFAMSDEVQGRGVPMLYWHLWDEGPTPDFNKPFYDSCNFIGCINKITYGFLSELGHKDFEYIPHAVDSNVFKMASSDEVKEYRKKFLSKHKDKFVMFYNSRNARRKMTSDVIKHFKRMLGVVGEDKAFLLMHTDPHDQEGANLLAVAQKLELTNDQIAFSNERIPPENMAIFYNMADVTVCLSNNEGFGLSSLESLMCGTPVISTRTGGLQDQNYDPETGKEYGVSLEAKSSAWTGSQQVPYITDCRATDEDILNAYLKMYKLSKEEMAKLGKECSEHARKLFDMDSMVGAWEKAIERKVKECSEGNLSRFQLEKI